MISGKESSHILKNAVLSAKISDYVAIELASNSFPLYEPMHVRDILKASPQVTFTYEYAE